MLIIARSALPTFLADLFAEANGVDGPLFEAVCRLYQNDFTPVGTMILADFTVATYDGYSSQVIDPWDSPILNVNGFAETVGPQLEFRPNGSTTPNVIYGYYVLNAAGNALLYAERFENPITLNGALTALYLTPVFTFGSQF
jgi:hypothetical protein